MTNTIRNRSSLFLSSQEVQKGISSRSPVARRHSPSPPRQRDLVVHIPSSNSINSTFDNTMRTDASTKTTQTHNLVLVVGCRSVSAVIFIDTLPHGFQNQRNDIPVPNQYCNHDQGCPIKIQHETTDRSFSLPGFDRKEL